MYWKNYKEDSFPLDLQTSDILLQILEILINEDSHLLQS